MEVFDAIKSRLEVKEYSKEKVPSEIKNEVLEAARLAPSGMNSQHWKFILLDFKEELQKLAEISTSGKWVAGASFAVVVLTNPKYPWHLLDAGRAITHMQLAAWSKGVGSRIYTGFDERAMKSFLEIKNDSAIAAVVGFGFPARKILGRKDRQLLSEVAFHHKLGQRL